MKKKSIIIIMGATLLALLLLFISYKIYNLYTYNTNSQESTNIIIGEPITIKNQKLAESEYLKVKNIMIKNDFEKFKLVRDDTDAGFKIYALYDEKNHLQAGIKFFEYTTFVEGLKNDVSIFGDEKITSNDLNTFIKKHKFKSDFELIEYLANLKDEKMTIFSSTNKIKNNYIGHFLKNIIFTDGTYKKITGDYEGYLNESGDTIEANIINGKQQYIISFYKSDYFTEDYIKQLISTIMF